MKKALLSIGLTLSSISYINAQIPVITNGSFETWSSPSGPLELEAPTGWSGSDQVVSDMSMLLILGGYDVTPVKQVYKITDEAATDGDNLAQAVTKYFGEDLGFLPGVIANGNTEVDGPSLLAWLESGDGDFTSIFNVTNASPMFGKRVDSVKVDANCWGETPLQGTMFVNAMKVVDGENVIMGTGSVMFENTTTPAALTEYTAYINYTEELGENVDTLIIFFMSSAVNPDDPGAEADTNYLNVDNVRLFTSTPSTGVNALPTSDLGIQVYPNPAHDYIIFNNSLNNRNLVVNVYSYTGQIMEQNIMINGENRISTSQYPHGTYIYEIIDTEKQQRQTGLFIR